MLTISQDRKQARNDMIASDNDSLTEDATFECSFHGISADVRTAAREAKETSRHSVESFSNSDTEAYTDTLAAHKTSD